MWGPPPFFSHHREQPFCFFLNTPPLPRLLGFYSPEEFLPSPGLRPKKVSSSTLLCGPHSPFRRPTHPRGPLVRTQLLFWRRFFYRPTTSPFPVGKCYPRGIFSPEFGWKPPGGPLPHWACDPPGDFSIQRAFPGFNAYELVTIQRDSYKELLLHKKIWQFSHQTANAMPGLTIPFAYGKSIGNLEHGRRSGHPPWSESIPISFVELSSYGYRFLPDYW